MTNDTDLNPSASVSAGDPDALCFRYLLKASAPVPDGAPGARLTYDGYVMREAQLTANQISVLAQGLAEKMSVAHGGPIDPETIMIDHFELRGRVTRARASEMYALGDVAARVAPQKSKERPGPSTLTIVNGRFALAFVVSVIALMAGLQEPTSAAALTENAGWLAAMIVVVHAAAAAWFLHGWLRQRPLGEWDGDEIEAAFRYLPEEEAAARRRGTVSEFDLAALSHVNMTEIDTEMRRRGVGDRTHGPGDPLTWYWPAVPFLLDLAAIALGAAAVAVMVAAKVAG